MALLLPGLAEGDSHGGFTVSGVVVNETAGGETPSGLAVFLLVTGPSGDLVYSGQSETGPDGDFSFPGVSRGSGEQFLFNVSYDGVPYSTVLTPAEAEEEVTLPVYETTSDVSVVRVQRQVLVIVGIDENDGQISALEFVRFTNESDRTLKPDLASAAPMMSFLRFSLPTGAVGLSVNSDLPSAEIISVGTGFAVTAPIAPGPHSVEYSFTFPYEEDRVSYRQNLLQGAEVYQVMVPEALPGLQVDQLEPVPPIDIQGTRYRVWEARDRNPRQGLTLEINNLPRPSLPGRVASAVSGSSFWLTAIPVLFGLGLAVALVAGVASRPRPVGAPAGGTPPEPDS